MLDLLLCSCSESAGFSVFSPLSRPLFLPLRAIFFSLFSLSFAFFFIICISVFCFLSTSHFLYSPFLCFLSSPLCLHLSYLYFSSLSFSLLFSYSQYPCFLFCTPRLLFLFTLLISDFLISCSLLSLCPFLSLPLSVCSFQRLH